jgi:isopenicillin N synthase-like dioxygenase
VYSACARTADNDHLTLLAQSALPGLVVATAGGEWIGAAAVAGTFVVNTGAMLEHYSNDQSRAAPHRVINRSDASRCANPFFRPNYDAKVEPAPTCVCPSNLPRYGPTTYGASSERLLTLNFAHRAALGGGGA